MTCCRCWIEVATVQQLDLFPYDVLTPTEREDLLRRIRNAYWSLRNLRGGRFGQAARRRHYRFVANQKKTPAISRRIEKGDFGFSSVLQGAVTSIEAML